MTSQNQPAASTDKPGRTLSIIGLVSAVVALVFIPIVFGPVGIILGFVGASKGDKPFGTYVGIAAIITTIVGLILGAVAYNSMMN
jgi:hypothetical protein